MRRALLTGLCAVLVTAGLLAVPGASAYASSTVVNPGFSANGATTTPTGWSAYSPNSTASASYSEATSSGYSGDGYQLTHWSSAAYDVNTYQYLSGLPAITDFAAR